MITIRQWFFVAGYLIGALYGYAVRTVPAPIAIASGIVLGVVLIMVDALVSKRDD